MSHSLKESCKFGIKNLLEHYLNIAYQTKFKK
jgi:hypothetical protein